MRFNSDERVGKKLRLQTWAQWKTLLLTQASLFRRSKRYRSITRKSWSTWTENSLFSAKPRHNKVVKLSWTQAKIPLRQPFSLVIPFHNLTPKESLKRTSQSWTTSIRSTSSWKLLWLKETNILKIKSRTPFWNESTSTKSRLSLPPKRRTNNSSKRLRKERSLLSKEKTKSACSRKSIWKTSSESTNFTKRIKVLKKSCKSLRQTKLMMSPLWRQESKRESKRLSSKSKISWSRRKNLFCKSTVSMKRRSRTRDSSWRKHTISFKSKSRSA